jgi:segregation and condensation protein A
MILDKLANNSFVEFTSLFDVTEGRVGVVVSLIAILELVRQRVLSFVQADKFGPIHVKATAPAGVK